MKKIIILLIAAILGVNFVNAQEEEGAKKKDVPVYEPFGSGILIDNQTCQIPAKKSLEMLIQHRFGMMNNGLKDLWGIYSPGANIRIGFNYVVINKLQVGYGLTLMNMTSDFSAKYNILEQTRKNVIPVFVTAFVDMGVDGRNNATFGDTYDVQNRFSYFSQLIVGRKFNDWLSLQVQGNFTHFNKVAPGTDHDKIGVGINGRFKISNQSSLAFQYDIPLKIQSISEYKTDNNDWVNPPFPNVGLCYEVNTGGHSFQIYVVSSKGILPQYNYMYNQNDWTLGTQSVMFGFTITRLWGF